MKTKTLTRLLALCAVTALAGTVAVAQTDKAPEKKEAEKPAADLAAAATFTRITLGSSGGFTGGGTGKWLSIEGTGKLQLRNVHGAPTIEGQLDKQQLADLEKDLAAIDWAKIKASYFSAGGADMFQDDLLVIIGDETHRVAAENGFGPPSIKELIGRLDALHGKFAAVEK
jgi:hypothetical protein